MKNALITLAILSVVESIAQSTLTFPFSEELFNETFTLHRGDAVNPGPAGENQVWDFSASEFFITQSGYFADPQSTSFASIHPNADLVSVTFDEGVSNYDFYKFEQDGVYVVGFEIQTSSIARSTVYSDFRKDLSSPMQYQESYTDSAFYQTESTGLSPFTSEGSTEYVVNVDGYGTLITPSDSYENVLRLHTMETTLLTVFPESGETDFLEIIVENYFWIIDGYPIPVFSTTERTVNGQSTSSFARYISGITLTSENFENLPGVSLYPVPAVDFVNLDMGNNQTGQSIVRIFDVGGALIKEFDLNLATETRFDVSDLPSGFYSLNIQTEEGMATKHFTK
jgi:hypothetical protein